MEEKKVMTHVTKGLLVSLVLIIIGVIGHITDIESQGWFRWISLIVLFFAVIWACVSYSNQMNNQVTFGKLFVHGFKMSIVIALISIVWAVLSMTIIFPEIKEKALDMARKNMEDAGKMSDSQIDQAMEATRKFFLVIVIGTILFGTLVVGAIASLIGAGVAKKKPVNPMDQMTI